MGPPAILVRALAGVYKGLIVVSLPGGPAYVHMALEKLIIPELGHMAALARKNPDQPGPGIH